MEDMKDLKESPQHFFTTYEDLLEDRTKLAESDAVTAYGRNEDLISNILYNQAVMMKVQRFMMSQMTVKPSSNPEN